MEGRAAPWARLAVLFMASSSACSTQSDDSHCRAGSEFVLRELYCRKAHECRYELGLSDDEFVARYGIDSTACWSLPASAFESGVLNAGRLPDGGMPDPMADYWWLVLNCSLSLRLGTCAEFAVDRWRLSGEVCSDEVMSGAVPPPTIVSECVRTFCESCAR